MGPSAAATTRGLKVVLATRNPGKAREFGRLLGAGFHVESVPVDVALPEETGSTFAENARLKALSVYRSLGGEMAVLADDSGIEVAALAGAPGVRSARFAGEDADDLRNTALLLRRLRPHLDRRARFVCALALVVPGGRGDGPDTPEVLETVGVLEGEVAAVASGHGGFGYDPVFRPGGWDRTLGEASAAEKDAVSHRSRAVASLLQILARRAGAEGAPAPSRGEGGCAHG